MNWKLQIIIGWMALCPVLSRADEATDVPKDISFRRHILPIMTKYGCSSGACHGAAAGKNGFKFSLRNWDAEFDYNALTRDASGRRIVKSDPAQSLILRKPTAQLKHGGGERFRTDSLEYKIIYQWIADGLAAPKADDMLVQRIEVTPEAAPLLPGQELQIKVRAVYSDNSTDDVTRWAKFSTTDEGVAVISDTGLAKGAGPGEAVLNIWYSSKVGMTRVSAPLPQQIDAQVYTDSPKQNFIDEHVLAKLKALNIPPSKQASDTEFIRRAFLDAAGILPSTAEVNAFLADTSPDKRTTLIAALMQRSELTDYWTYKLSDILLLSNKKLKEPSALLSFYRYLRAAVAANKPWDQLVRDIVTAKGSNFENGAVNFFVIHKETTDATETTSQAFLGLSVTCAKCHNHPLEKWTLNDYYGFANLLSRVKLKNGDRTGEVLLEAATSGEIDHPITGKPLPPKPLDGEAIAVDSPQDRREHLAKWLTSPENPYFARAMVNRVWKNFMGRGLAEPEDDLRLTNPVSNEALMTALVKDFIENKFDIRHLMSVIMNSAAYQRSSLAATGNEKDEKYYSRYVVRRLPAEVILDAYTTVSGVQTDFPGYPAGYRAMQLPDSRVASYFLDTFGRPDRTTTCSCERSQASTITQALHVSNGDTLNNKLRAKNSAIDKLLADKTADPQIVDTVYMTALCRQPSENEKSAALAMLTAPNASESDRREKLEDLFWAVATSKEFLFNH